VIGSLAENFKFRFSDYRSPAANIDVFVNPFSDESQRCSRKIATRSDWTAVWLNSA